MFTSKMWVMTRASPQETARSNVEALKERDLCAAVHKVHFDALPREGEDVFELSDPEQFEIETTPQPLRKF